MGNVNGMEYWIPRETCGEGMNHYCLGQLSIVRANRTFGGANLYKKKALLRAAKDHTEYTLTAMRDYPSCPIREHAETTLKQIESQLRAFRK